ncbi:MAG: DNA cytosine methyltransferase [Clostridia bacterium]|nr:DNA cytosine methyltransferase [Clostridia bacterium]
MEAQISIFEPMIVDNFAGGGGASTGIELATGRPVDIAINHNESAIMMHRRNHPYTRHYQDDVWILDPLKLTGGRPVHIAWFSPDCKHFSRASGGALKDRNIRGLAWVAVKWAGLVQPDIIIVENVPEFLTWGPVRKGKPVKSKAGQTFAQWKKQLEDLGYVIEYRELCAADYGAPTIRTRLVIVARRDGRPIVWPQPTHGPRDSAAVKAGERKPWRAAAEIIDFSLPTYSIFESKEQIKEKYGVKVQRPLRPNTMKRIALGTDKFVIREKNPFIVNHKFENKPENVNNPLSTVTAVGSHELINPVVSPYGIECNHTGGGHISDLRNPTRTVTEKCTAGRADVKLAPFHMHNNENARGTDMREPVNTVTSAGGQMLVTPALIQYHGEQSANEVRGQDLRDPLMTVDASNRYGLMAPILTQYFSNGMPHAVSEPLNTITARDGQFAEIRTMIVKWDGQTDLGYWPQVRELLNKYTDWRIYDDEVLLLWIRDAWYFIRDIGLRMLTPRELYNAMGFPPDYIIDRDVTGKKISRADQVARCGNAVCPPMAAAVVRCNCPELCPGEITTMKQLHEYMTA